VISQDLTSQVTESPDLSEMGSLEEDLLSVNAVAPELLERLSVLFEETVRDALCYMLGEKASKDALGEFRKSELENRQAAFGRLTALYGPKASPLQKVIDRVFGMRVHDLLGQII
jgi:hypothetical protein